MVRKRQQFLSDLAPNRESIDSDFDDSVWKDPHEMILSDSELQKSSDADVSDSSDSDDMNEALYERCKLEYNTMKKLKRKLKKSIKNKSKKSKPELKNSEAFTRFSVSYFSKIIESLSPERKDIIKKFGFGCLLMFEKCFVPTKFAAWVANQVDYKSGDIILKDKVISLTKESVHMVLDLPIGGATFPSDNSSGKSVLLSMFGKASMPSVKFFGEKLIKNEAMTDDQVVSCFLLVALSCFLCPNSSLIPSSKYLSIFEDLASAHELDWSKLVLDWLLDGIMCFNKQKISHNREAHTLGGCLYYLAVVYLDFIDFGSRQPDDSIPRINVWKNMMIKDYSDLDLVSPGTYGYRPVLDISKTCYKQKLFHQNAAFCSRLNQDFKEKLDFYSGCRLPISLKDGICNMIDEHCFNSGLTFNMDVNGIACLPRELKCTFATLLEHVYSVDTRTQDLVLKILKLVANTSPDECDDLPVASDGLTPNVTNKKDSIPHSVHSAKKKSATPMHPQSFSQINGNGSNHNQNSDYLYDDVICTQVASKNCQEQVSPKDEIMQNSAPNRIMSNAVPKSELPVPKLSKPTPAQIFSKMDSEELTNVVENLARNGPSKFVIPPSGYPPERCPSVRYNKRRSRMDLIKDYATQTDIAKIRDPFCDLTNDEDDLQPPKKKKLTFASTSSEKDVILLDKENDCVPKSTSASPVAGFSRYFRSQDNMQSPAGSTQQTPMVMHTLPSSQYDQDITNSKQSATIRNSNNHFVASKSASPKFQAKHPEVQVLGERCLADSVKNMTKQAEQLYDKSLLHNSDVHYDSPQVRNNAIHAGGSRGASHNQVESGPSTYKARDSSSGGKVPIHGPRRILAPGLSNRPDFVSGIKKTYTLARSEVAHYRAICNLAMSKWKDEDAINIGNCKCTFKTLGDSLRPGGFVLNFVVASWCRHLFMKPNGHPDVSRRHYFFSSIGDNLLKDPADASVPVLERAFTRSRKARPLNHSDMLFFPILYDGHWSVFVVDIKDRCFVFLDSYYHKDHEYQEYLRERLIPNFQVQWDIYYQTDMKFDEYQIVYPVVPQQSDENLSDSGIFVLMFSEHWTPRVILQNIFDESDIPNLRVKIANTLMFFPHNNGMKNLVIGYNEKDYLQEN